jgi:hypothetical protein
MADWFTQAMDMLKIYFPQNSGDGDFWERRIKAYRAILSDVPKDEMKTLVRHVAETRKFPSFPTAADIRESWVQLRNASYPGADPAEERERQERESERLQVGWIDKDYDRLIRPLPREKQEFIRSIPPGSFGKLGAVCMFKSLEAGLHEKSEEWRKLG